MDSENTEYKYKKKPDLLKRIIHSAVICLIGLLVGIIATICVIRHIEQKEAEKEAGIMTMEEITTTISTDVIEEQIKDIGELATVEYLYTDSGKFDDDEKFESGWFEGMKIPFSGKSFIARWDGKIKAGIDVSKVSFDVDNENKIITIYMPEADVLSHEILEDSIETLDESKNIFNQIEVNDVSNFIGENKEFMKERAISNGLLETADKNAKALIQNSLEAVEVIKNEYKIVFEELPEDEESTEEDTTAETTTEQVKTNDE